MPRTTLPQFPLGDISRVFTELCAQVPDTGRAAQSATGRQRSGPPPSPLQRCVTRVSAPIGAHQTSAVDSEQVQSSVDELYRLSLGLETTAGWRGVDRTKGWTSDTYNGVTRLASYATSEGKRAAFVRIPERRATVIILTNDANADARAMSERILDQLLAHSSR
jgi:hypothetical protein